MSAQPPFRLFPLSAVPLGEAIMPAPESLNAQLTTLFLKLEQDGAAYRTQVQRDTQHGLFESKFDLHLRKEPEVRNLFGFIHMSLAGLVKELNEYSEAEMGQLRFDYHSWFHVTRTGGYQGMHNHPNASWSGIYCVDPGDDDGNINSGAVRFHDARVNADMYSDPGNERMRAPYRLGGLHLRHTPGRLLLFPSYILHEVFPYTGQRPRIVVAFNAWCWWADRDNLANPYRKA
ncbi:MAG TPA: TIGR02466 family protein [Xanthomonadaceae bacterium]|nr:TIGR02466 family protein [Xanthomonadaceae bacterium]